MLNDSGCVLFLPFSVFQIHFFCCCCLFVSYDLFYLSSLNLCLFITVPCPFVLSQNPSAALSFAMGGGEELLCLLHVLHMNDV